jgi:hypothetical protein
VNSPLGSEGDSHRHNCVNFFDPHINYTIAISNVQIEPPRANQIHGDVEVFSRLHVEMDLACKMMPPMSHVQCFALQKPPSILVLQG